MIWLLLLSQGLQRHRGPMFAIFIVKFKIWFFTCQFSYGRNLRIIIPCEKFLSLKN